MPQWHEAGVQLLLQIDQDQYERLLSALASTGPTLSRLNFLRAVSDQSGMRFNEIDQIVTLLVSLYTVRANLGLDIPDFVTAFSEVVKDAREEGRLSATDDQVETLLSRMTSLLALEDTVGVLSKASYLWSQHENVFSDTQILTDIRPVFKTDAKEPPVAAMIIHKLRITYSSPEEHRSQDIFIALDSHDLALLRRAIDRAQDKAQSLSQVLAGTPMHVLQEVTSDS
jgi:hypothetical protein